MYENKFPSDSFVLFSYTSKQKLEHKWAWLADRFFGFLLNFIVMSFLANAIAYSFGFLFRSESIFALTLCWYFFLPRTVWKFVFFENALQTAQFHQKVMTCKEA